MNDTQAALLFALLLFFPWIYGVLEIVKYIINLFSNG
jgi:hypothetical protein